MPGNTYLNQPLHKNVSNRKVYIMKKISLFLSAISVVILSGCATQFAANKVDDWQPEIVATKPPADLPFGQKPEWYSKSIGFANYEPIVPTFNNKGNLLASWNPGPGDVKNNPTFVVIHGGHGITPSDLGEARWLKLRFGANVLILDSFWSRGEVTNFRTFTKYGANMRVLDVLAAGKWLRDVQGVDTNKLFVLGSSQGGWTVLRLFTDDPFYQEQNKNLFKAGISLYPVCTTGFNSHAPDLGPYYAPVIVFTGEKDTATNYRACDSAVFTKTQQWTNYPDATHAWNTSAGWKNSGGFGKSALFDKECHGSLNNFQVCRSDAAVYDMHGKITKFIKEQTGMNYDKELEYFTSRPDWAPANKYPKPIVPYQEQNK